MYQGSVSGLCTCSPCPTCSHHAAIESVLCLTPPAAGKGAGKGPVTRQRSFAWSQVAERPACRPWVPLACEPGALCRRGMRARARWRCGRCALAMATPSSRTSPGACAACADRACAFVKAVLPHRMCLAWRSVSVDSLQLTRRGQSTFTPCVFLHWALTL